MYIPDAAECSKECVKYFVKSQCKPISMTTVPTVSIAAHKLSLRLLPNSS